MKFGHRPVLIVGLIFSVNIASLFLGTLESLPRQVAPPTAAAKQIFHSSEYKRLLVISSRISSLVAHKESFAHLPSEKSIN